MFQSMHQPTHDKRNQKQKQISLHSRIELHAAHTRTNTPIQCVHFQIRTDRIDEISFAKDCLISFNFDLLIYVWSNQLARYVAQSPESVRNDETVFIWFSMSQNIRCAKRHQRIMMCVCVYAIVDCATVTSIECSRMVASSANTFFLLLLFKLYRLSTSIK